MPTIRCPKCDEPARVRDDAQEVSCRACGHAFQVTDEEEGAYSSAPMGATPSRPETSDERPRRRREEPDDDSDDERPRRRREESDDDVDIRRKKSEKTPANRFLKTGKWALKSLGLPGQIILGLAIVAMLASCLHPICYFVPIIYGLILMGLGSLLFLVVVFNDSPTEIILCMFVPFYSLFYLISHWEETKASFYLQMFGTVVCFSFVCAVPFHAAVFGARDAIMGKRGPEHAAANKRPERNNPPPDNKPIEDKPIENKPIENKPIENKPIDKKPEENKPIENKPIEKKPVEKKPPPRVTGDEALDQTLADLGDEKTVVAAAGKLAGMKPNQHQAVVAQRLGDTLRTAPVYNRTALLRAMQKWATPTEVPLLLQLLEDKDINTRNEVLQVLGKVPDERAVRPVVRCFSEFQTTYHGELALIEMGSIAEKEVLPLATGPNRGLWVPALRVLKEIGTLHSVPTLQILTKGDITVQDAAQQAVAAIYARNKKK